MGKIILAVTALLLTACSTLPRPIDEACAATDEKGNKSAECAEAVAYHGAGGILDAWSLVELIGFLAH